MGWHRARWIHPQARARQPRGLTSRQPSQSTSCLPPGGVQNFQIVLAVLEGGDFNSMGTPKLPSPWLGARCPWICCSHRSRAVPWVPSHPAPRQPRSQSPNPTNQPSQILLRCCPWCPHNPLRQREEGIPARAQGCAAPGFQFGLVSLPSSKFLAVWGRLLSAWEFTMPFFFFKSLKAS